MASAREWAAGRTPGQEVDWAALQDAAFESYPAVRERLASKPRTWHEKTDAQRVGAGAGCVAMVLSMIAPVVGLAASAVAAGGPVAHTTMTRDPSSGPISVAAVAFAVSFVAVVAAVVGWVRGRRHREPMYHWWCFVVACIAAGAAPMVRHAGRGTHAATWPIWDGIIVGVGVVSLAAFVVMMTASRPALPESDVVPAGRASRVYVILERLTPEQRAGVVDDLRAAVDVLRQHGVIDEATAKRARKAELGLLPETMLHTGGRSRRPEQADDGSLVTAPGPRPRDPAGDHEDR